MDYISHPLPHFSSPRLDLPHGLFMADGGNSSGPFTSLNLSFNVGDSQERVQANRTAVAAALGLRRLASAHQVHGDQVLIVDRITSEAGEQSGFDALITAQPGIGLLIQHADCQPILLADQTKGVVAAIHCGWRGSVDGIIGKTVARLRQDFNVNPVDLDVLIGPSLGPCCAEFKHYRQELPQWMHAYQVQPLFFDFWAISRHQLRQAGLLPERIEVAGLCTCCDPRFFSYRRAVRTTGGITGRNGSVIALPYAIS